MGIEELKEQIAPIKNTLVIYLFSVVMLVDVIEGEDDYYWLFETDSGCKKQVSCLLDFVPLKGYIATEQYERLVYFWDLNKNDTA